MSGVTVGGECWGGLKETVFSYLSIITSDFETIYRSTHTSFYRYVHVDGCIPQRPLHAAQEPQ